jgi:hypothetical protein
MTSGRPLTERQRDSILRLVGYVDTQGLWLMSYDAVAHQVGVCPNTVSECVRRAAASWGRHTQWHDVPEDCQDEA